MALLNVTVNSSGREWAKGEGDRERGSRCVCPCQTYLLLWLVFCCVMSLFSLLLLLLLIIIPVLITILILLLLLVPCVVNFECCLYVFYWPELWKRRTTHCYCWTYLLKHIQQIHRIQRKRWQFTSSSTLLYSTDMGARTLHQAHCSSAPPWSEPSSRLLHMLCIRCNKGAFFPFVGVFCLSFWSHIKKHVHTLSTFLLLDWSIFFY